MFVGSDVVSAGQDGPDSLGAASFLVRARRDILRFLAGLSLKRCGGPCLSVQAIIN